MNAMQNFAFEEHLVRAVDREDGEPWFVGKDVCAVLDIKDHHQALDSLDEDERGGCNIPTPSGEQTMIIVSEAGVYRLVFRSRKPQAERFKRWLAHEVLPQIRKTGAYAPEERHDATLERADIVRDAPLAARVEAVRLARALFGPDRARKLWGEIGLPTVPQPSEWEGMGEAERLMEQVLLEHLLPEGRVRDLILLAYEGAESARLALLTFGIRVAEDDDGFWLGHSVDGVRALMGAKSYNAGWVLALRRLPGARPGPRQTFAGRQSRTTWFPLAVVDGHTGARYGASN